MQYILIVGNPVERFYYIGPFDSGEAADEYARRYRVHDSDCWITSLTPPQTRENANG